MDEQRSKTDLSLLSESVVQLPICSTYVEADLVRDIGIQRRPRDPNDAATVIIDVGNAAGYPSVQHSAASLVAISAYKTAKRVARVTKGKIAPQRMAR